MNLTIKRALIVVLVFCMAQDLGMTQDLGMAQENIYKPGEILMYCMSGVVVLPPGKHKAGIEAIHGSADFWIYLNTLNVREVSKVLPDFSSDDSQILLEDDSRIKILDYSRIFKLIVPQEINIQAACDSLELFPEIIFAQPNYLYHPEATPNDPYFTQQWSLDQGNDCDIDAQQAWDIETGNYEIKIGILDQGVQYNHEDLGNGFGYGYKVRGGYDFYHDDPDPNGSWGSYFPHGTWVAGIASALTNNGIGVAGISGGWGGADIGCSLYAYEIASPLDWPTDKIVSAILRASRPAYQGGDGVHILNASFGSFEYDELLRSAVITAYKCMRVFVASKGNENVYTSHHFPSDHDAHCVLSVGATDNYDQRWVDSPTQGSNWGGGMDCVAPGYEILNTAWAEPSQTRPEYESMSGTSAAAPHVAGLAGLIWSRAYEKGKWLQPEDVEGIMRATAKDLGPEGYDDEFGAGRINAYDALRYFDTPQSLRRFSTYAAENWWLGFYPLWLFGIPDLPDDQYQVGIYEVHSDNFSLPNDILHFLGIWGLGRLTTGYSFLYEQVPHYGEGWCTIEKLSNGQYRAKTYVYHVMDLNWNEIGWFPCPPENVQFKYSLFSVFVVAPYNLRAVDITETSLTLRWNHDYPEHIDGYTVKRDGQVIGNPPGDQLYCNESGLEPGRAYHYEVLARKDNVFSAPAQLDISTLPSSMLVQSDSPTMSAFNSNRKVVRGADGQIHIIYNEYEPDRMYYNYSMDNGNTFQQQWDMIGGTDTIPALAMDDDGTLWAVGACTYFPNWYTKRLEYYLYKKTGQTWVQSYDEIYQKNLIFDPGSQPPPDVLYPVSFTTAGDFGYIAFREVGDYPRIIVSSFPLGVNTCYTTTQIADSGHYPSIGYDEAGRIVVLVHEYGYGPLRLYFNTINNGNWYSIPITGIPDEMALGSPSLWVEENTVCVAVEAFGDTYTDVWLYYWHLAWNTSTNQYEIQTVEKVAPCDYDDNGVLGYSSFASRFVVLWKYQDDIWYSKRTGETWSSPVNISDTPDNISSYPQGLTFRSGVWNKKLFTMWTETIGNDYYLLRRVLDLPDTATTTK